MNTTNAGQFGPPGRNANPASGVRPEGTSGEERPFSEIRRNLQDGLRILSLHRWAFFVPFTIVTSGAFLLSLSYPRTYSATTTFERRNDPIMVNLPLASEAASFKYFRSTMERDLTSVQYMGDVVENLGLTKDFPRGPDGALTAQSARRRNSLAGSLGGKIRVATSSPNDHVDIITITYTGEDPHMGKRLLDEVKKTYIRRTMAWIHQFLSSQRDYYLGEQTESSKALKDAEREQTRLRLAHPYASPRDPGAIATGLSQLERERNDLELRRREYKQELSVTKQLLARMDAQTEWREEGPPEPVRVDPTALLIRKEIQQIDAKVAELRQTRGMTDEHPEIKELKDRRSRITAGLAGGSSYNSERVDMEGASVAMRGAVVAAPLVAQDVNGERARLEVQLQSQESKIKEVELSLESNHRATRDLAKAKEEVYDKQSAFEDVDAAVGKARKRYAAAVEVLGRIDPAIRAIEQDRLLSFSEGQPARGSVIPVNPRAMTIILLALLAGGGAGVVFVILAEVLDHVYRSSGQVARSLGLPILDTIDVIVTSQDRRRLLVQRSVLTPLLVGACLTVTTITGALAYCSIQRPWTFQRIISFPGSALKRIADSEPYDAKELSRDIS